MFGEATRHFEAIAGWKTLKYAVSECLPSKYDCLLDNAYSWDPTKLTCHSAVAIAKATGTDDN